MSQKVLSVIAVLALALALLGIGFVVWQPFEAPEARTYENTACYAEQGGASWVAGDGCTWSVASGGTLAVASGGTFTGDLTGDVTGDLTGDILGSSGTSLKDNVTITGTLDVAGASINYGPNDLYPIGYTDSGFQAKWGSDVVTGTKNVTHGLTSPVAGVCTLAGELTDNEEQVCSVKINGSTVSIYVYKEAGAAGDSGVTVYWWLIGTP